ncbi:MAG: hypothetical protein JSV07_08875 [Acidimicrobiia bacterium]|nr:MAG: hypothetical protein JSV07_08875 [Acidimicrobiia bacterium]
MTRLLVSASLLLVLLWAGMALAEEPPGECDLDPSAVGCDLGGIGGGGGGTSTTTTTVAQTWYWGAWTRSGMDCSNGDPRYLRLMYWDDGSLVSPAEFIGTPPAGSILGAAVIYQQVCVAVVDEADAAWEDLVRAVEALPSPSVQTSPEFEGVTGLESWFWFDGSTTVGPVAVSWTDPSVGTTFALEGRAWVGSVRWEVEPGVDRWATSVGYADTSGVLGSMDEPTVRYRYEVSSADAGFDDGYPIAMTLAWEGEWRWRERGGPWQPWRPMATTVGITSVRSYPVLEVVGVLDPP